MMHQTFSIGFKYGLCDGQSIALTLDPKRKFCTIREVCFGLLSFWNIFKTLRHHNIFHDCFVLLLVPVSVKKYGYGSQTFIGPNSLQILLVFLNLFALLFETSCPNTAPGLNRCAYGVLYIVHWNVFGYHCVRNFAREHKPFGIIYDRT